MLFLFTCGLPRVKGKIIPNKSGVAKPQVTSGESEWALSDEFQGVPCICWSFFTGIFLFGGSHL